MLDTRDAEAPPEEEEGGTWMLSYGDMMTLLLTFFVLLFAMSTFDVPVMREMVISLRGTFGVLSGGERVFLPGDLPEPEPASGEPVASHALMQALPQETQTEAAREEESVEIEEREGAIIVRIPTIALFEKGDYHIRPDGARKLDKIAELMRAYGNDVTIVGHADTTPVAPTSPVSSNWHLAALRAAEVVKYFIDTYKMDKSRFSTAAYGDTITISPEDEKNRRVEIIFRPLGERAYPDTYRKEGVQ